jgi:threonine/homoserine/homoserine lactone efflux protein
MDALILGLTIGAAAGISPGPLLILVITQTLRSGWRAGLLTAAAPLLTDAVVIAGTLLVLDHLPRWALPVIGVLGGLYVGYLAVETWRSARTGMPSVDVAAVPVTGAVRRAAVVNLLSPHPWITWATALGPLTLSTWRTSGAAAVTLVVGFYVALVGAKAVVAALVAGGRARLTPRAYTAVLRAAAVALMAAGVALVATFAPVVVGVRGG